MYLGALKAAVEMAAALGENDCANQYLEIFTRGKAWVDDNLFNGEYYFQKIDLNDRSLVEAFDAGEASMVGSTMEAYWDEEHSEVKYQVGEGCLLDQVLAQWHADLYGLGDIFDPQQVNVALASIFQYNFISPSRKFPNPCRIFSLNDESGLVIAAWPEHVKRPTIPAPYSQETMNGFEYAAAIHMIGRGMVVEGMRAITALRERYDGERRNPWNEFECGSNYARSMASFALLNVFSGFQFDLVNGQIGFAPIQMENGQFRCFWSLEPGWGEFLFQPRKVELHVLYGQLDLRRLEIAPLAEKRVKKIQVGGVAVPFQQDDGVLIFPDGLHLDRGQILEIESQE